jgi:hypothetical protein
MIYKTVKIITRALGFSVYEKVLIETWWFLFIPIYTKQTIIKSNR